PFKPSMIRVRSQKLDDYILPAIGGMRLGRVERRHVQAIADEMMAKNLEPSTIRAAIDPLSAIYKRAIQRGEVAVNPAAGLDVPAANGRRERVASPDEARKLIAALAGLPRIVFATALYAGLRYGELRALRWSDVNLETLEIHVERSLDVSGVLVE